MNILDVFKNKKEERVVRPYIIAEAGVNHEGDIDIAKRLINEAKEGGADAIKFQSYKASTIAVKNSPAYWDLEKETTTSQYELFSKYDKFWKNEMEILKAYCDKVGIEFMSTPFDIESAHFLEDLMPVYKISSSDITNKPFIKYLCGFNKPIILSTGASYDYEIDEAISWIQSYNTPLALLHCILNYPTLDHNANLGVIATMSERYPDTIIGYSDHTLPADMSVCEIATLLGSRIIEKHFTHDKTLPGNDHYHAMDKDDLKKFNKKLDDIFKIIGSYNITSLASESSARDNARRSLVSNKKIEIGKTITTDDLTFKRPAHGISPKYIDDVIGKKAIIDIPEDEILQWDMFVDEK